MNNQDPLMNIDIHNSQSLQILRRAIQRSQGDLSLILLKCNYQFLRDKIMQELKENNSHEVINLPKFVPSIYKYIKEQLGDEKPSTLVVFGLDSVAKLDDILRKVNLAREEFRNNFHMPILFWVTEDTLKQIQDIAPDFYNWTKTINFPHTNDDLIKFIGQLTKEFLISAGNPNSKELDNHYSKYVQETIIYSRDVQKKYTNLPPDLEAQFELILGFYKYKNNDIDSALKHYNKSLVYWKEQKKTLNKEF